MLYVNFSVNTCISNLIQNGQFPIFQPILTAIIATGKSQINPGLLDMCFCSNKLVRRIW